MYVCVFGAAQQNCFGLRLIALQILNETFLWQVTLLVYMRGCVDVG